MKKSNKHEKFNPCVNMDASFDFYLEPCKYDYSYNSFLTPDKYDYAFNSLDSSGTKKRAFIKKE